MWIPIVPLHDLMTLVGCYKGIVREKASNMPEMILCNSITFLWGSCIEKDSFMGLSLHPKWPKTPDKILTKNKKEKTATDFAPSYIVHNHQVPIPRPYEPFPKNPDKKIIYYIIYNYLYNIIIYCMQHASWNVAEHDWFLGYIFSLHHRTSKSMQSMRMHSNMPTEISLTLKTFDWEELW